jgi:uncharacterized protein YdhG (YjbR/CyaY superfamily)
MSTHEIDAYLVTLAQPQRETLGELRNAIMELVPDAERCTSYTFPAFRLDGKLIAGFGAFTNHLSYFPHSGSVLSALQNELIGYTTTKGTLHFAPDAPLPRALVKRLIDTRIEQLSTK